MRRLLYLLSAGTVAVGVLAPLGSASASPAPRPSPVHLAADADGGLRRAHHGSSVFVGARAGTTIDDPGVTSSMSSRSAATAHLERYGAELGIDAAQLTERSQHLAVDGDRVVRYRQSVSGVPVFAGQAAVSVTADNALASIQANTTSATSLPSPTVSERAARAAAAGRRTGHVTVSASGRWLLDPALIGMRSSLGPRGVWRFVVGDARGRDDVMVDDTTGRVLLSIPLEETANRVVCNRAGTKYSGSAADPLCESGYARSEGQTATGNGDVDSAYDLAGETSALYASLGVDLTDLIGRTVTGDTAGPKRIESTVHFCYTDWCPFDNAFWDGSGMYYGDGYASADDVVGHEMTHGFTERTSNLAYWGQSGAINESISDIMGEILDHRFGPASEDNSAWLLGEDLPGGAIRSMRNPTLYGQPDSMTSAKWSTSLSDSGGVHTNSGVGNKTAYLISQGTAAETGGAFNGQSFGGIDAGDPTLAKSAELWAAVDQHLISGSNYADLGLVLDQECTQLRSTAGFTASDCDTVHSAGLATQLATERSGVPTPATQTCPSGVRRVLFDSSTATPHHGFTASGSNWQDQSFPGATSALNHWVGTDLPTTSLSALLETSPVTLPAGQPAYLWFRHKFLLDFEYYNGSYYYYDGGVVGVDDLADPAGAVTLTSGWVNGPTRAMQAPYSGYTAFSGDSIGWWSSRVDLSSYAGKQIRPSFTLGTDSLVGLGGWEIGDVVLYTCDQAVTNLVAPSVSGTPRVGSALTASPGQWTPGATFSYQWLSDGTEIDGATGSTYTPGTSDVTHALSVRVTAAVSGIAPASAVSASTAAVGPGVLATGTVTVTGTPRVGSRLSVQTGSWGPEGVALGVQWLRGGTPIPGATTSTYTLAAADRGTSVTAQVTGTADGYAAATVAAAPVVVGAGVLTPGIPRVTGTTRVGKLLTAVTATWRPAGVRLTYQWLRDGKAVAGARARTYRLRRADRGHRLRVRVTGALAGYTSSVRVSAVSNRVR